MRYHLFLHYGWFIQNLEKDFVSTNILTTVGQVWTMDRTLHKIANNKISNKKGQGRPTYCTPGVDGMDLGYKITLKTQDTYF